MTASTKRQSGEAPAQMDAATLEALKGSIAKWEAIVAGTGEDEGPDNCPLCQMFNYSSDLDYEDDDTSCLQCPVYLNTGQRFCHGSPYQGFADSDDDSPEEAQAAVAELAFLKSLLPQECA